VTCKAPGTCVDPAARQFPPGARLRGCGPVDRAADVPLPISTTDENEPQRILTRLLAQVEEQRHAKAGDLSRRDGSLAPRARDRRADARELRDIRPASGRGGPTLGMTGEPDSSHAIVQLRHLETDVHDPAAGHRNLRRPRQVMGLGTQRLLDGDRKMGVQITTPSPILTVRRFCRVLRAQWNYLLQQATPRVIRWKTWDLRIMPVLT